ncbi:MAG: hypothetical protein F4228_01690 [Acidobacteria bacterium]|nr:hypothetical protein [Acidobacteriota bacterium]MXZ60274.1 hypothetical protein [Acidobacteriota bacterium]MYA44739.1 hypothetical protein [Acidobacteriota bacterium]MYF13400.1 hypothetical protein [Acidobacteriota bacterium]MYI40047.1 hypothetical protein [Acidobacteriota bacterium]
MNVSGIIKGGLVAGLLINVSEYVLNMMVIPVPEGAGGSIGFWVVYAFVMGLLTAYLYALIRPRCGAGPKTGVCAGLLVWALHTLLPAGGMWNMGMAPDGLPLMLAWTAVELALAGVLAGMLYSE